jgi:hypothetical protein
MWDVFTAYQHEDVKTLAAQISIRLEFIPPEVTTDCQPLDQKFFENLKSRARAKFDQSCVGNHILSI